MSRVPKLRGSLVAFATLTLVALAACTGGTFTPKPAPTATPTSGPTATPTAAPAAVAVNLPLTTTANLTSGATAPPVTLPAPSGYAQTVSLPVSAVAANTTVQVVTSVTPPTASQIPPLSRARTSGVRTVLDDANFVATFYTVAYPSSNVTLAGSASQTITFPAGALTAGTSYYLAFYDSTVANPQWNTIAGPVTASGNTLTFSGTIPTYTLLGGNYYGVAVFSIAAAGATPPPAPVISTPTPSPTPSPKPSPTATPVPTATPSITPTPFPQAPAGTTTAFGAGGSQGLQVFTATSVLGTITYPTNVDDLAMDDSGNMYIASAGSNSIVLNKYPYESTTSTASYNVSGSVIGLVSASGAGRLVFESFSSDFSTEYYDVWESGVSGAPSFTITLSNVSSCGGITLPFMEHNGTLIIPAHDPTTGALSYNFYSNGSATSSKTITESIVPVMNQCSFATNYIALSPDSNTLYVTEYTYAPEDTLAGLYVYPLNGGSESFVATPADSTNPVQPGSAPWSIDTDASGNVYVANDNSIAGVAGGYGSLGATTDTLHEVAIYGPGGSGTPRLVSPVNAPGDMIIDNASGTTFVSTYGGYLSQYPNGAIDVVPAGSSTVTTLPNLNGPADIVLFSGTAARNILSVGSGHATSHGSAHRIMALRRMIQMRRR
jgi:hypothetical protein